ncbi:MAG: hypothetical protein SFV51_15110 [Bryobacteraceae bacterium]|nr:hypothetical protein [Bryobacteraceae bacterium]
MAIDRDSIDGVPCNSGTWATKAVRAFADGFGGGLIGGLIYCLALAYLHPARLESAWLRVAIVSLAFGCFEMWRVTRNRTLRSVRVFMIWTAIAGLFALWALAAVSSTDERPEQPIRPRVAAMADVSGERLATNIAVGQIRECGKKGCGL